MPPAQPHTLASLGFAVNCRSANTHDACFFVCFWCLLFWRLWCQRRAKPLQTYPPQVWRISAPLRQLRRCHRRLRIRAAAVDQPEASTPDTRYYAITMCLISMEYVLNRSMINHPCTTSPSIIFLKCCFFVIQQAFCHVTVMVSFLIFVVNLIFLKPA